MPGIFGFRFKKHAPQEVVRDLLQAMATSLMHQDTYAQQIYWRDRIGLGVISFKSDAGGRLLPADQGGPAVCVHGELFRIGSATAESSTARSDGVSRAIRDLYRAHGTNLGPHLNGDFTIAIDDPSQDRLLLLNDRFGFRHVYVYEDEDILMFAPEIKAFLRYPDFSKSLDEQGVADFFNYFYQLGDRTMFRNVRMLSPASCLTFESTRGKQTTYWEPRYSGERGRKELDEAVETSHRLFRESIERRVRGRKHLIVPLSGGLDSRLILATVRDLGCSIHAVTFGEPRSADFRIARQVCRALDVRKHTRIEVSPECVPKFGERMIWLTEASYATLATTRLNALHERIRGERIDGLLNGIFGGHLCFGPPYFAEADLASCLTEEARLAGIRRELEGMRFELFLSDCATPTLNDIVSEYARRSVMEEWQRTAAVSDRPEYRKDRFFLYNRMRRGMNYLDLNRFFCPSLLPFADYELFDFYLTLRPDLLLGPFLYRELFKKKLPALAEIPWQSTGLNLYRFPSSLRVKTGRWKRATRWYLTRLTRGRVEPKDANTYMHYDRDYRRSPRVRTWIRQILLSDRFLQRGLFCREGIERLLAREERGASLFHEIGKLAAFEIWARQFLDEDQDQSVAIT